jgi:hypothetical protein
LIVPAGYIDTESAAAAEGTAAHELAAACLTSGRDPEDFYIDGATFYGHDITPEMVEHISYYVNRIRGICSGNLYTLEVEAPTSMETIHPKMWGTTDTRLYSERKRHLMQIDLKYGAGVGVEPYDNWQLLAYGVGSWRELEALGYEVRRVTLVIFQPRYWGHKEAWMEWETDVERLEEAEKKLHAAARRKKGNHKPGPWCKWCMSETLCDANHAYVEDALNEISQDEIEDADVSPEILARIAALLDRSENIRNLLKAAENYALSALQLQQDIPGYELEDINGNRFYKNEQKAIKTLHKKYGGVIYEPRKLKSPRQLELAGVDKALVNKLTDSKITGQKLKRTE